MIDIAKEARIKVERSVKVGGLLYLRIIKQKFSVYFLGIFSYFQKRAGVGRPDTATYIFHHDMAADINQPKIFTPVI
jgi:hypothetical protein